MPLASGGMARIYIARATGIGSFERHVVLKMILPERAQDETSVQMFLDEARLAASLNHQNVAQVFEVGVEGGIHFLAMEYVHGQDLRALLARAGASGTRVPLDLALTVVAGAASGLEHAHERRNSDGTPMGIVHRDVSPSNIIIGYDGAVKLLDFGIAKATSRSVETQSGIIKGKFAYMAPEQCRGRDVDRRSDVFSLGIILYEVTTQHRCFRADSDFDTMHRIVTGDIVRPSRLVQGYPQALEAIVMRALAVDANQRYQSAALLLEALESFAMAARMSLSTMSLGRFMRDMFGDVPEPWLQTGRFQPVEPKEQTISNTNASGDEPRLLPSPPIPRAASPSASGLAVPWPASGPGAQRPSSPSGAGPVPQRPPSSSGVGPAPAPQRPSSPSASGPAPHWPTSPPPPPGAQRPSGSSPSPAPQWPGSSPEIEGSHGPGAQGASSPGSGAAVPRPSARSSPSSSPSSSGAAPQWPGSPSASGAASQRPSSPPPAPGASAQRPSPASSGPSSGSSPALRPPSGPSAASSSPDDWANPQASLRRSSSEGWSDALGSFDAHSLPLPPAHEEAPLHLPPELPMELPLDPPADLPERPSARMIAATMPGGTGLGKPIATASLPLHFGDVTRSESGPSHHALSQGSQPIARTRRGYANAPAISGSEAHPRFAPQELDGNVSLQPSNRLLYIALGVVLIGIIVLLAISIAEGPDELPPPMRPTQSQAPGAKRADPARLDPGRAAVAAGATTLKPDAVKPEAFHPDTASPGDGSVARRASIHLHVVSTPPGADVLLSGKPIGTTPLDTNTERSTGTEVLTIHRARYQDVTVAVDLARDYDQTVILIPAADPAGAAASGRPVAADRDRAPPPTVRPATRDRARPAAPARDKDKDDCQPPDKINPFENACHGHVCKPCPTTTP